MSEPLTASRSVNVNTVKLSRSGSEPVEPGKRLNRSPFDRLRTNG
ncbi:MAG: hypothetical protein ACRERV_09520 [Methylococcales bacterium]